MTNLLTVLIVVFTLNGNVYEEVAIAPSMEICNKAQLEAKRIIIKSVGKAPDALFTTCVTLKPLEEDA